ncbi:hypothetical protein FXF46_07515 [Gluconobacter thailandicus]|uniref:Uncharacterized protein n=1 Tax=Gluconobacter thailandicus TaxID=257438 RepID=A0AAP9JHP9_GLUTH|nr:hypothetical protein FXF46_07515 [Gluconobacter thailandicus]
MLAAIVMEVLDDSFLDCPAHPFELIIRPEMMGFFRLYSRSHLLHRSCRSAFDTTGRIAMTGLFSELDAVIRQKKGLDAARNDAQKKLLQELLGRQFSRPINSRNREAAYPQRSAPL